MVTEEWKKIPEYPNYSASNLGNIRNDKYPRVLRQTYNKGKYKKVRLFNNGVAKTLLVHSLVCKAFGIHKNGLAVNHINYDKNDNRLCNLECITTRENVKHSRANKNYYSSYIGVSWYKRNQKWSATIFINKKNRFLGLFNTEIEASNAYNLALSNLNNNTDGYIF